MGQILPSYKVPGPHCPNSYQSTTAQAAAELSRHFYPNDSPNLLLWQHKVGMHPDRIENLYFTFLLVSRAVALSLPHLTDYEYDTGDPSNDDEVAKLLDELAELPIFQHNLPCFD